MTPGLRGLLITALIALAAGFSGVGLGKIVFDQPHPHLSLHEVVHNELNLTAAQQRQIESLEADFATRRHALEAEMRAANAELASAIREEHGYGPGVAASVERFHHGMGNLQTATIRHVFAMREVLSAEQKQVFDNTVVTALTTDQQ